MSSLFGSSSGSSSSSGTYSQSPLDAFGADDIPKDMQQRKEQMKQQIQQEVRYLSPRYMLFALTSPSSP